MPNHSIKKKKSAPSNITIDEKHSQLLDDFHSIETVQIPQLESERAELKSSLEQLPEDDIDARMEILDQVREIGEKLKRLRSLKNKYLLDNVPYIFNYFEEKKKISTGESSAKNVLNSFFKVKQKPEEAAAALSQASKQKYQNYWKNVNREYCNTSDYNVNTDICQSCRTGELIPQDEEGIMICNNPKCGVYIQYIVDNEKPIYKEPPNEVTYNAYVRLNHFKEILSQFQAKETTQIPPHVIEAIR